MRERTALSVRHGERAHGDTLGAERRHRGRADRQSGDQVHGGCRHALGDLDPLALDGKPHQAGVGAPAHLSQQRLQRPARRHDPEHGSVLVLGQDDDGAVGLEEASGIARDLIHDAVELDRFREDVAQLLEREQLADAPVELARQLLALVLRLAQPAAAAQRSRPRSWPRSSARRPARSTTLPVGRQPRDDAEHGGADDVERHLPLAGASSRAG